MAKFIRLFCMTGLGILLLCLISCEQKQEPVKTKKQIMVVSKSIDLPEKPVKQKDTGKVNSKPSRPVNEPSLPVDSSVSLGKKDESQLAMVSPVLPSGSVSADKAEQEVTIAGGLQDSSVLKVKTYETKGRVDPFIPLLSEKKEDVPSPEFEDNKPKRILTPLEKMDLSQIRLVALIEMKGRSIAMVEEASGKGYEVRLGTYMGRNQGQVSAIDENGIVVKDYIRDFKGNRRERLQEIKFHKSEGGE